MLKLLAPLMLERQQPAPVAPGIGTDTPIESQAALQLHVPATAHGAVAALPSISASLYGAKVLIIVRQTRNDG